MPNEVLNPSAVAPEEIAAPALSGETAPDPASGDNEQDPASASKPKSGFQKRIDRLTRSIGDRDRYIQYLESAISAQAQQPSPQGHSSQGASPYGASQNSGADARPSPDDFERQTDYLEALADWKTDQRIRHAEAQRQQQEAHRQHHAQFQEKQDGFRQSTPDYDEILVDSEAPVSPAMAEEIRHHEHGPALMYFLAKNPDVAEQLASLAPTALAREIGRLEASFVSQSDAPQTAAPNISKAPKPPSRVGQTARTAEKDPGEMSPTEYREWRRKQFPHL